MSNDKIQLLLGKIETTYGVDSTPAGATNALLVEGLDIKPLEMSLQEREHARLGFDTENAPPADLMAKVSFSIDLSTSDAAGTAPQFGPLLRACGMAETVSAGVSVAYAPAATAFESITLWGFKGATKHAIVGARGTFSIDAAPRALPKIRFDMIGLFADPTDGALPSMTYAQLLPPKPVNKANTAFTANSFAAVLHAFQLNLGVNAVYRDKPNYEAVDIDARATAGSFTVHKPALASLNHFTLGKTPTPIPLVLTHTLAAGRAAAISLPACQLGNPTYSADGNQRLVAAPFNVRRNGSSAAVSLTFT